MSFQALPCAGTPSTLDQGTQSAIQSGLEHISGWESTTSLSNLCQCLTTLVGRCEEWLWETLLLPWIRESLFNFPVLTVLAVAAVSQEKWVIVEEPVVFFPLRDPYLSLEKSAFHWMQFRRWLLVVLFCFFFLLIITKPFGDFILDLMMPVLRVWMEELDVWNLVRHAALHLLPAAAVRVNKRGMCVHALGTVHDMHLYTPLLLACYNSFSFAVISLFIVYLVSLIKSSWEFQLGILLPHFYH